VSEDPSHRSYWRVGHTGDPLGFVPLEICEYSHRFDDLRHRFRTVYIAELAETSLRETLADFRPKLSAIGNFQREMGAAAATDLPAWPITAAWRREHVLAPLRLKLDGRICDLTDIAQRRSIEERHAGLLLEHGMQHLDLHEITTSRRVVTQTSPQTSTTRESPRSASPHIWTATHVSPCSRDAERSISMAGSWRSPTRLLRSWSRSPPPGTSRWRPRPRSHPSPTDAQGSHRGPLSGVLMAPPKSA